LITNAKISHSPFDIYKSKFIVTKWHYATNINKTYNCLIVSIKLNINSWKKYFLEGKTIFGHKCILNRFIQILCTNYQKRWFFTIKRPKSSKNYFCCRSSFLKGSFATKNWIWIYINHIWSFFWRLSFICCSQSWCNPHKACTRVIPCVHLASCTHEGLNPARC